MSFHSQLDKREYNRSQDAVWIDVPSVVTGNMFGSSPSKWHGQVHSQILIQDHRLRCTPNTVCSWYSFWSGSMGQQNPFHLPMCAWHTWNKIQRMVGRRVHRMCTRFPSSHSGHGCGAVAAHHPNNLDHGRQWMHHLCIVRIEHAICPHTIHCIANSERRSELWYSHDLLEWGRALRSRMMSYDEHLLSSGIFIRSAGSNCRSTSVCDNGLVGSCSSIDSSIIDAFILFVLGSLVRALTAWRTLFWPKSHS